MTVVEIKSYLTRRKKASQTYQCPSLAIQPSVFNNTVSVDDVESPLARDGLWAVVPRLLV